MGCGASRSKKKRTQHGAAGAASAGRAGAAGTGVGNLLLLVGGRAAADGCPGTAGGRGRRGAVEAGAGGRAFGRGSTRGRLLDNKC